MSSRSRTPSAESWTTDSVNTPMVDTPHVSVLDNLPLQPWPSLTQYIVDEYTYTLPSEEKYRSYYEGLPSSPRLVATTSAWKACESISDFRHGKFKKLLRAVTNHSIQEKWYPGSELSNDILIHLDSTGLQWTTIDVLEIGYEERFKKEIPTDEVTDFVTLFISVGPQAVSWATAMWAASNCKRILKYHGITDMEVDIKESVLGQVTDASREDLPQTQHLDSSGPWINNATDPSCEDMIVGNGRLPHLMAMMSNVVGSSLAPAIGINGHGSKTLYLRVQKDGHEFHAALTSRRVVMGSDDFIAEYRSSPIEVIPHLTPATLWQRELYVSQMGVEHIKNAKEEFAHWPRLIQDFKWHDSFLRQAGVFDGPGGVSQITDTYRDATNGLGHLLRRLQEHPNLIDRRIGRVIFAPKIDGSKGWMRDYALIKLDPRQHAEPEANRALIKPSDLIQAVRTYAKVNTGSMPAFVAGAVASIPLKDPLTEGEIIDPRNVHAPKVTPDNGLLVGTYGAESGAAIGIVNGVRSITRRYFAGRKVQSWEFCVVDARRNGKDEKSCFSKPGDAGACVWTLNGSIVGMVTSGAMMTGNRRDGFITTYVTPLDNILGDLVEEGYDVSLDLPLKTGEESTP